MLRTTIQNEPESLTFRLEGRLAGTWVQELAEVWRNTITAQPDATIRLDVRDVVYVDGAGREFLAAAHAQGAQFIASGCLMRAIVAHITHNVDYEAYCPSRGTS